MVEIGPSSAQYISKRSQHEAVLCWRLHWFGLKNRPPWGGRFFFEVALLLLDFGGYLTIDELIVHPHTQEQLP